MEKYFEGEPFTPTSFHTACGLPLPQVLLNPCLRICFRESRHLIRTRRYRRYFPLPTSHRIKAINRAGEEVTINASQDEPLAAFVFKTFVDPFVGRISLFRVFSGEITSDGTLYNASQDVEERLIGLNFQNGKKQEPTERIVAGDIGSIAKLSRQ